MQGGFALGNKETMKLKALWFQEHLTGSGKACQLSHPLSTKQLRLHQHRLHRLFLQVRRVAVFVQDALHHDANLRAGAFPQGPVDGHTLARLGDEFGGDDFEFVVAHGLHGGFVGGEGIVEGDNRQKDRSRVRVRPLEGVPVKPMKLAFGRASRSLSTKP